MFLLVLQLLKIICLGWVCVIISSHRCRYERKEHRNHTKNKLTSFLEITNWFVPCKYIHTFLFILEIKHYYLLKEAKGMDWNCIKLQMEGVRQYSWDVSFPFCNSEFSSGKLGFADQHKLKWQTGVILPRRHSIVLIFYFCVVHPRMELISEVGEVFLRWVAGVTAGRLKGWVYW